MFRKYKHFGVRMNFLRPSVFFFFFTYFQVILILEFINIHTDTENFMLENYVSPGFRHFLTQTTKKKKKLIIIVFFQYSDHLNE